MHFECDRYFVTYGDEPEQEVTVEEFMRAERRAGFNARQGMLATSGFMGYCEDMPIRGRIMFGELTDTTIARAFKPN